MIELFYWPTPNGQKISIMLEETGIPFRLRPLNIGKGEQFEPWFLALNPNNRMPAIIDHAPGDGGGALSIFESGAILMYLADKAGMFWPSEIRQRHAISQWLVWQVANHGPKLGENGHFRRAAAAGTQGDLSYARRRFDDEANRLYGVMDEQLSRHRHLAGEDYSIADIACYPWAVTWEYQGQSLADFPNVARWIDEVGKRRGVVRGMATGADLREDLSSLSDAERERRSRILMNQRARPRTV